MVVTEMKALREGAGLSHRKVGDALGITGETYRLKELSRIGITGEELARLARLYDLTLQQAFPSYVPTEGEKLLAEDMAGAA